ncbi:phospholipase A1-like isoform X2 [Contarinia nasturtii]|uniref:phospholipase A1-like isoform X2 n=1 Tax=Contarinia nasturtii TaxID=265458 RepID=UPI0012D45A5E|nr:phospholipase A1-like isoform X2 [Contarinia nasturtii]
MANHSFKFHEGEIEIIKKLVGKRDKIILFFLGYEDQMPIVPGRHLRIARGPNIFKDLQYFTTLKNRLPKVVDMSTSFIQNIVDSNHFKIKFSSVYLSGFSLVGHVAGNVGLELQGIYDGKMVPAIWEDGKPRRVQKGDGKLVVVFHSSWIGGKETIVDVDVILNNGNNQPGCENPTTSLKCSHRAAFILRELIIIEKSNRLLKNRWGIPYAQSMTTFSINFP